MNRDLLESQWTQIREILREKFSNLTEEDIRQINGRYDQLVDKLQQKYGYTREEAEERIRSWNFDRFAGPQRAIREDKYYQENKVRKEEDRSSILPWVLGLGIPLLLLAAYMFNTPDRFDNRAPVAQEQVMAETPADRALSTDIRNAFMAQNISGFDLQNIQITARNGIVTLSGTVPNREVHDRLFNTAQGFAGVRQVIDNLRIR